MHRPAPPPFRPYSVHFAYKGSNALRLVNHKDDTFLGEAPEWVEGSRNKDAAYVKGAPVTVQVVFILSGGAPDSLGRRQGEPNVLEGIIGATCDWDDSYGLVPTSGDPIKFNPNGKSDPVEFTLKGGHLHDEVGSWHINWLWHCQQGSKTVNLGITDHVIHTTWRPLLSAEPWVDSKAASMWSPADGEHIVRWTYLSIVRWTCGWIHDTDGAADNEQTMCDAMIKNLPKSGLSYYVMKWAVKDMLNNGGGMCGGWYKMFQAMAAAHGISLERRMFLVDRVDHSSEEAPDVKWDAIVVRKGGVGLPYPVEVPSTFHDARYNGGSVGSAEVYTESRYRFWGIANGHHDGHCVNFLKDATTGKYTLYDPSFGTEGIELDLTELPEPKLETVDSWDVGNFKEAYLDDNIEYLMGSLFAGGEPYKAFWDFRLSCSEVHHIASFNGVTVETRSIKERALPIPFLWGP